MLLVIFWFCLRQVRHRLCTFPNSPRPARSDKVDSRRTFSFPISRIQIESRRTEMVCKSCNKKDPAQREFVPE